MGESCLTLEGANDANAVLLDNWRRVLGRLSCNHLHRTNGMADCGAFWAAFTPRLGPNREQFMGLVLDGDAITDLSLVGIYHESNGGYPHLGLLAVNPLDRPLPQSIHPFSHPVEK
ncbi:MAG: hypothetical protein MK106_13530 [Mariniblastus sp.]|nr:hypothetical protein [Mariniblastus sp.]